MLDNNNLSDQNKPIKNSLVGLWDQFGNTWKSITGLSTTLYVAGFIVSNLYLGQFGYYSTSLINSQYIIAGLWSLLPILLALLLIAIISEDIIEKAHEIKSFYSSLPKRFHFKNNRLEKILESILEWVLTGIFWLFIFTLFFVLSPDWRAGADKFVRYIIVGFQGIFVTALLANEIRNNSGIFKNEWTSLIQSSLITTFFLVLYLASFSWNVYGDIPSYWGGGKPRSVQLIVQNENQPMLMAAEIHFPPNSLISETVNLVLATDQEYIFLSKNAITPLAVKREIVEGVLYGVP